MTRLGDDREHALPMHCDCADVDFMVETVVRLRFLHCKGKEDILCLSWWFFARFCTTANNGKRPATTNRGTMLPLLDFFKNKNALRASLSFAKLERFVASRCFAHFGQHNCVGGQLCGENLWGWCGAHVSRSLANRLYILDFLYSTEVRNLCVLDRRR